MAQFQFDVLSSPEQAYNLAQKRVQVFKDAAQHIGEAANRGMAALEDESVKNRVISALTSKWPGLKDKEEDLRQMDSKTLAGQAFLLNTVDNYIKTKKAEHPDEGVAFSAPETFFGTNPSHLEQILKAIDGQATTAKDIHEKRLTAEQLSGLSSSASREQNLVGAAGAVPGEAPTQQTLKTTEQFSKQAELDAAKQRGLSSGVNVELSREQLIKQIESEKNDEEARKVANKFKLSEAEKDWKKWKKTIEEGMPYDAEKDKQMQNQIIALKIADKAADTKIKEYVAKMKGLRQKWGQVIPEPKTSMENSKAPAPKVDYGKKYNF